MSGDWQLLLIICDFPVAGVTSARFAQKRSSELSVISSSTSTSRADPSSHAIPGSRPLKASCPPLRKSRLVSGPTGTVAWRYLANRSEVLTLPDLILPCLCPCFSPAPSLSCNSGRHDLASPRLIHTLAVPSSSCIIPTPLPAANKVGIIRGRICKQLAALFERESSCRQKITVDRYFLKRFKRWMTNFE